MLYLSAQHYMYSNVRGVANRAPSCVCPVCVNFMYWKSTLFFKLFSFSVCCKWKRRTVGAKFVPVMLKVLNEQQQWKILFIIYNFYTHDQLKRMLNIKISFVIFSSHSYDFNFSYFILSTNISLPVSIVLWSIYGIFISLCQFHIYIKT